MYDLSIEKVLEEFHFYVRQGKDGQIHFFVKDQEVTQKIRDSRITEKVSPLSAKEFVRKKLLASAGAGFCFGQPRGIRRARYGNRSLSGRRCQILFDGRRCGARTKKISRAQRKIPQ